VKKGRPKGYSPYAEISYGELGDWLGKKSLVKVSKAWLESLINQAVVTESLPSVLPPEEEPKIEFTLTDLNNED
jgi:hypothetical protein